MNDAALIMAPAMDEWRTAALAYGSRDGVELKLQPLAEACRAWRRLAVAARGATVFHREPWLDALGRAYRLELLIAALEAVGQQTPIAGAVLARSPLPFSHRLIALPFTDSCPPLGTEPGAELELLRRLAAARPLSAAYEIRGFAAPPPWRLAECFVEFRLDLDRSPAAIESGCAAHFRRHVRHARSHGISVCRASGIGPLRRFYKLLLAARRRLGLPAQPLRFLSALDRELGADLEVWIATCRGNDIASMVLIRDRERLHYKLSARDAGGPAGAAQLLLASAAAHYAGRFQSFELGRADVRNRGLCRFKSELGAQCYPLPYAFLPSLPRLISPEALTGPYAWLARLWRLLPPPLGRVLGGAIYRYLA